MSDYFSAQFDRLLRLAICADAWLGTPYVVSGAVRGSGASCHCLAAAVLSDAGWRFPPPPPRGLTRLREYTASMRAWLDSLPEYFAPIPLTHPLLPDTLQPGDVLLCELGCGHIALYLGGPDAEALQVLRHTPAHVVSLHDPQVPAHILAAYRPQEAL
jgi:hypothetical protein